MLTARIARKGKRVVVYGNVPAKARMTVKLRRGKRVVRKAVIKRTRVNAYQVTFKVKRNGRYRATVRAKKGKTVLKAASRRLRVR